MKITRMGSCVLAVCLAVLLSIGCAIRSPIIPAPGAQGPPVVVVAPGSSQAATRRQIAINLDRGQLTVGSLITIKRDLRAQNIINHDQEQAITDVLSDVNNGIREALKLMEANPAFDLSSTGKIASLVSQVSAAATRLSGNRLPPAIEEALRKISELAGTTQRLFE